MGAGPSPCVFLPERKEPHLFDDETLGWDKERPEPLRHSLLALDFGLADHDPWDEAAIRARGGKLADLALKIRPH